MLEAEDEEDEIEVQFGRVKVPLKLPDPPYTTQLGRLAIESFTWNGQVTSLSMQHHHLYQMSPSMAHSSHQWGIHRRGYHCSYLVVRYRSCNG